MKSFCFNRSLWARPALLLEEWNVSRHADTWESYNRQLSITKHSIKILWSCAGSQALAMIEGRNANVWIVLCHCGRDTSRVSLTMILFFEFFSWSICLQIHAVIRQNDSNRTPVQRNPFHNDSASFWIMTIVHRARKMPVAYRWTRPAEPSETTKNYLSVGKVAKGTFF